MSNSHAYIDKSALTDWKSRMASINEEAISILNETKAKFGDINNLETGTYQGARKPAELKEELDTFSDFFHLAYEQICKSADDIKKIANISEQQ